MNTKHISLAFVAVAVAALFAGCTKNIIEKKDNQNTLKDLELANVSSRETKAALDGTTFPQDGHIGLFLFKDETATNLYADGCDNVDYSYDSGKGKWTASPSIKVGSDPGYLFGYYPYSSTATDIKAIPVKSSLNGDDVMYATKQTVTSQTASQTSIIMNHALARVSITVVNKGYTGDAKLSQIKFEGAKIAANGTLDATTGTISGTTKADVTLAVPEGSQTITATGTTYECLLVPSEKDENKQDVTLSLTIDGQDKTATLSGDNGVLIAQNTKSNITITLSNSGISVQTVSVDEWNVVEVGGHKVTVKFDERVSGIEEDVWVMAYAKNGDVIIKSFSSNGKKLSFRRNDTGTILGIAPQDNIYDIVLSEVKQDITVTIDYFLNSNSEFTTISGHKVSVVLDADTDILKGISIDDDKLVIEAESSSDKPVKCVKDGERITGSKTGTLNKFTISDITDDATVTIGYSKYTATIGFTQGSVTDKATLKINGDEVEAGGSISVFEGTDVEYSAVADDGYLVFGWYDNNGQKFSDAESFTVSGISSDVAYYAEVKAGYKLTVNTISARTSTIAANGVSIESGRAYSHAPNTQITLTASPAAECNFVKWCDADGETLSTDNPYSVTLTSDLTIIAVFAPKDALSGVFTVSDDGNGNVKKVRFSKGNLYCSGVEFNNDGTVKSMTNAQWGFEVNQYDTTPSSEGNRDENHISHFMWCNTAEKAMALKYDSSWNGETPFFAAKDFTVNGFSGWRVLTGDIGGEWEYLLDKRNTKYGDNRRYAAVKVNSMAGLLIFPDDFSSWPSKDAGDEPQTFNTFSNNWNGKDYTAAEFTVLQNNGCVFLPAAGDRNGSPTVGRPEFVSSVGDFGSYWSASANPLAPFSDWCCNLEFYNTDVYPSKSASGRFDSYSIRLVTDAK